MTRTTTPLAQNPFALGIVFAATLLLFMGSVSAKDYLVSDQAAFKDVVKRLEPGDRLIMADGDWTDFQMVFEAEGTAEEPITLMAQTPGSVILNGQSNLRIGGRHLVVWGLTFRDGYSPTSEVISFRRDKETFAFNTRLVETVVDGFNKPDRADQDSWVVVYGQNNRLDRNAFVGKTNKGPTMIVRLNSPDSQENNHVIERNFFGERAPLGGNGGETLRIGTSFTSRTQSNTVVRHNYFERCDGEVEIISIKSEGNLITENVFFESRGSVVFRHGGKNKVSRNVFMGNGVADTGGIRVINDNQEITENYLEGLRGQKFLGALVVMNGVPNSPENRYHQVENAKIHHNSFVDIAHMGFAVGSDEERSAAPKDSQISSNVLISNATDPVGIFDDISGITFDGNITNNDGFSAIGADVMKGIDLARADNGLLYVSNADVAGDIGAPKDLVPTLRDSTGPRYYEKGPQTQGTRQKLSVGRTGADLANAVKDAPAGAVLKLKKGTYQLDDVLLVDRMIDLVGAKTRTGAPKTILVAAPGQDLFHLVAGGRLTLENVTIQQTGADTAAFRAVADRYLGDYQLTVRNVTGAGAAEAGGSFLVASPHSFAQQVDIEGLTIADWSGDVIDLSGAGLEGWYMTDDLMIRNSEFTDVSGALVSFGRDGRDESTFGPRFKLIASSVTRVNQEGAAIILGGVDGLAIHDNSFTDTGTIAVKRRVLGMPFEVKDNSAENVAGTSFDGVAGEPLAMSLAGGAE